jgi:hypothetical protein
VTAFAFTGHGVAMLKCNDTGTLDELMPPPPSEDQPEEKVPDEAAGAAAESHA